MNKIRELFVNYHCDIKDVQHDYDKKRISLQQSLEKQQKLCDEFTQQIFDIIDGLVPKKETEWIEFDEGFNRAIKGMEQNIAKLKEGEE